MLAVVAVSGWLPQALDARAAQGAVVRAAALALAIGFCAVQAERLSARGAPKDIYVGRDSDAFWADSRGLAINAALNELERTPATGTFAVLPEGVMLNYLTRRVNPTSFVSFMPPEVMLFGEAAMIRDFAANPPDRLVLVHRPTVEYGLPLFGRDYATELFQWLVEHYTPVATFGDRPLTTQARFGVEIWERHPLE